MIQYFVYAITMAAVYLVIRHLHNKDNSTGNGSVYVVRLPTAFIKVYSIMFWVGIGLFVLWGILYFNGVQGEGKVTVGHLVFALVFGGIGLLAVVWGYSWRITIDGQRIKVHRLFRKEITFFIYDINVVRQKKQTRMGSSERIIIRGDGKKIAKVDWLCENYERFEKDLTEAGKL